MALLSSTQDLHDAELKGSGSANLLHQAQDVDSREGAAHAELLLPCARGYCLHHGASGAVPAGLVPLGEGDAAVCVLARGCGSQPCIALARAGQNRLELWRLGVLLEVRDLPGVCRALSWRRAELAAATSNGAVIVGRASGDEGSLLLLEPRSPTLALAWLEDGGLAVAHSEDSSGVCAVRLYARLGSHHEQCAQPTAEGAPPQPTPLAPQPFRTITLGAGRVCSMCVLPGSSLLAVALTRLTVSLAIGGCVSPSAAPARAERGAALLGAGQACSAARALVGATGRSDATCGLLGESEGSGRCELANGAAVAPAPGREGDKAAEEDGPSRLIDLTGLRALGGAASGALLPEHPLFRIHAAEGDGGGTSEAARSAVTVRPAAGELRSDDASHSAEGGTSCEAGGGSSPSASTAALCIVDVATLPAPAEPLAAVRVQPTQLGLPARLPSPNMLAAARNTLCGRAQRGQWVVAVGSSVRSTVELCTVSSDSPEPPDRGVTAAAPLRVRCCACVELPSQHGCHGLSLRRDELLVLCSRPGTVPSALFTAQYAKRGLQLRLYSLSLPDELPALPASGPAAPLDPHGAADDWRAPQGRRAAPAPDGAVVLGGHECLDGRAAARVGDVPAPCAEQEAALRELHRRMSALATAYSVDWGAAALLSVDEDGSGLTFRVRLQKR